MARQRLEVADVVRAHGDQFLAERGGKISSAERRVLDDIAACRTATLGGHVERCDACGHERISYNSCRNRHCPKCQEGARADWLADREQELLDVEYFHVVFTIPSELGTIALQNRAAVYEILFRASAETLNELATDSDHLGARIGFLSVLHTWGQRLDLHPHVHCLVPGGALSADGSRWIPCKRGFFLPVAVLRELFRGKFLHHLREAFDAGKLIFKGSVADLQDPSAFRGFLAPFYDRDWVVYVRPPFGEPAQVLRYLARYTHRVAISNNRLREMKDGTVTFVWKDYRHDGKKRTMTLAAPEFLRRFLLHLLPKGFQHIRHYGFLANRCRRTSVDRCRELIAASSAGFGCSALAQGVAEEEHPLRCPACNRGRMACILVFRSEVHAAFLRLPRRDSS